MRYFEIAEPSIRLNLKRHSAEKGRIWRTTRVGYGEQPEPHQTGTAILSGARPT